MQAEVETQVADALRAEAAAPPAAPSASTASVDDLYAQLTKLGELREMGLLSEAEFAQQKARLLA
jgi:hypothetical protein